MKSKIFVSIVVIAILTVFAAINAQSNAEMLTVTGRVTEAGTQIGLAGVEVSEKDAANKTVTGSGGNYTITVERGRTLVFSAPGYISEERKADSVRVDVSLKISTGGTVASSGRDSTAFGSGGGVNDMLGALMGGGGGDVVLKKRGELRVSSPQFLKAGSVSSGASSPRSGGDGGVGRKGVAGIGYGSGYGSGFGGGGGGIAHLYGGGGGYDSQRNEEYGRITDNRFKNVSSDPLSTFSLDVDVASYSNVRRMINMGQAPDKDAVRVEQLINYFSYDYPQPNGRHPVSVTTEVQPSPWNRDFQLVRIGVKAKEIPSQNIPASNFVYLIDVSGSMSGRNRLPLVKSSLKLLTNNLREKDRVAIVTYSDQIAEVLPSTSGADRQKIFEAIDNLQAAGGTAGGAGIQRAYEVAQRNFIRGGNNRVILCTDGDFNIGISSPEELERFIEEKRKTGVFLTVLGYGMGNYKDNRLQTLSQKGNGNHAYIDNLQEANRVLVQEFGSTMYAVANDVKMQVEFNPAYVSAYRLVGYESRLLAKEDFNDDTKDAGELGAGHTVTAFYEIIPAGVRNPFGSVDSLKYQQNTPTQSTQGVQNNELMNVKVRYKPIGSNNSVLMETPVMTSDREKSPSADFNFAAAVAMFGQLLRDSDFKGTSSYDDVVTLARRGLGEDPHGYRREFVRLVESMRQLVK